MIKSPDFISTDIRGEKHTFLLNAKVAPNRFLEASIQDKNGQTVIHFMRRNENKNNKRIKKIIKHSEKHDFIKKKSYNLREE